MKVGDLVRVKDNQRGFDGLIVWHEFLGKVGVIVADAKRMHVPAAKVIIAGEIAEFDLEELEEIH